MQVKENKAWAVGGFLPFVLNTVILVYSVYLFIIGVADESFGLIMLSFLLHTATYFVWSGFFVVQPNEARAIVLLGSYLGSIRTPGWWFTVPISSRRHISLRVRNFNSEKIKVNDSVGNPIDIAAVVVYRVTDSAKALFDVQDYEHFVAIQSETCVRHLASRFPYDAYEEGEHSLRGNPDEAAVTLLTELQARLGAAGVHVLEARLTHLAYAPEIAAAMLQRQQASAIVAARQKIVEGAVGMAQMALQKLKADGIVELDEERKAAMVNNLMVAIVGERGAQPIINTGSLY
jgi:regulator of protease activity HflC (stomatin/prohibitin superfamily)